MEAYKGDLVNKVCFVGSCRAQIMQVKNRDLVVRFTILGPWF